MTTNDLFLSWQNIGAGVLFGSVLAIVYLLALWFSVRRIPHMTRPGLWLLVTSVFRITAIAAAFVWLAGADWQRRAGCLAGFVLVRWTAVNRVGAGIRPGPKGGQGAH